ncbi:MAG: SCO family protein [Chitinophagales bacterium]
MKKRNNILIAGGVGVAFILFFIFVYLPYADRQNNVNKITDAYQHSSYLKDSVNHIPQFKFTDQNGTAITNNDIEGKVFVADFFYTTCEAYCPITTAQLEKVQNSLNHQIPFKILSFSLNPATDSVEMLKQFAIKYKANDEVWHFLRGSQDEIFELGEKGFFTIVKNAEGSFEGHSDKFTLVDKKGNIRGFYSGTDSLQVKALIQDINYLVFKDETNE